LVADLPAVILNSPETEQVDNPGPASAVGALVIVNDFSETAFPQGEFPAAVSIMVTLPRAISSLPGVYAASVIEFALVNTPFPLDVQVIPL
jgi:hypothetical protein